ncbi:hypothetical protein [Citrobacter koseri]|uniref:hypothetical protein n=1 Tax=Citrobacter koseri TaxID=545 RepID=UPI00389219E8
MNITTVGYVERHGELREKMASVDTIIGQLSGQEYASMDTYLNNMDIITDAYQLAADYLDGDFQVWLKQYDLNLFITLLSVGRAIALMNNLLQNLQRTLTTGLKA